jgi:hypothetical protein
VDSQIEVAMEKQNLKEGVCRIRAAAVENRMEL